MRLVIFRDLGALVIEADDVKVPVPGSGGAAADPHVAVVEFDGEGGLGDQHGEGLVLAGAAEGYLLPDDHDHAGVAGPALDPDRLG
jgi:hypothetical protein